MRSAKRRYLIGIDEAGRGPLAGPIMVGAVAVPIDFDFTLWNGLKESKQLSPAAREKWFAYLRQLKRSGGATFHVGQSSASAIDRLGVVAACAVALEKAISALAIPPSNAEVRLDGLLQAPSVYRVQKTIVRGDALEPIIAMASVAAKVTRDRHMERLATRFPEHGFSNHKGYGTAQHRAAILQLGLTSVHRRSFCRQLKLTN